MQVVDTKNPTLAYEGGSAPSSVVYLNKAGEVVSDVNPYANVALQTLSSAFWEDTATMTRVRRNFELYATHHACYVAFRLKRIAWLEAVLAVIGTAYVCSQVDENDTSAALLGYEALGFAVVAGLCILLRSKLGLLSQIISILCGICALAALVSLTSYAFPDATGAFGLALLGLVVLSILIPICAYRLRKKHMKTTIQFQTANLHQISFVPGSSYCELLLSKKSRATLAREHQFLQGMLVHMNARQNAEAALVRLISDRLNQMIAEEQAEIARLLAPHVENALNASNRQARGIPDDLIDKLSFSNASASQVAAYDSSCVICFMEYEDQEQVVVIKTCKHMFHYECINQWYQQSQQCPLDRQPIRRR